MAGFKFQVEIKYFYCWKWSDTHIAAKRKRFYLSGFIAEEREQKKEKNVKEKDQKKQKATTFIGKSPFFYFW